MRVLYVEPFHGGSHQAFGEVLERELKHLDPALEWTALTLPARHWKWRMRGSAAFFAHTERAALSGPFDVALVSAYCNLAELRGFAPELADVPAVLYFHENQFAYPTRPLSATPGRAPAAANDQDYGFTQLISALAAECCAFNSAWNRDSFLDAGEQLLRRLPDANVPGWIEGIRESAVVLGVPLDLPELPIAPSETASPGGSVSGDHRHERREQDGDEVGISGTASQVRARNDGTQPRTSATNAPLLLWNHRWEHDKRPEVFLAGLRLLLRAGVEFRLAMCGQRFRNVPPVLEHAREWLPAGAVVQWGHAEPARYRALLSQADIAVSTAGHEFFGVSMLEATWHGAWPLVPDRLSYPELFPEAHRYADDAAFFAELERLCRVELDAPGTCREAAAERRTWVAPFAAQTLVPRYRALLERVATAGRTRR